MEVLVPGKTKTSRIHWKYSTLTFKALKAKLSQKLERSLKRHETPEDFHCFKYLTVQGYDFLLSLVVRTQVITAGDWAIIFSVLPQV